MSQEFPQMDKVQCWRCLGTNTYKFGKQVLKSGESHPRYFCKDCKDMFALQYQIKTKKKPRP